VSASLIDEAHWLTPGVRGIGGASLLSDLSHEIPTSLLRSVLTSTLGAPASALGLSKGSTTALPASPASLAVRSLTIHIAGEQQRSAATRAQRC